jgi:hypothetical protein
MDRHAAEHMDGPVSERVGGRVRSVRTDAQPSAWTTCGRARGQGMQLTPLTSVRPSASTVLTYR